MLGFSSQQSSDFPLPPISEGDGRILKKFIEMFGKRGDSKLLQNLMISAKRQNLRFSKNSLEFWAPLLVNGKLGPLEPLLSHPQLEEIMINELGGPIFIYHKKEGMIKTGLSLETSDYFLEISNLLR